MPPATRSVLRTTTASDFRCTGRGRRGLVSLLPAGALGKDSLFELRCGGRGGESGDSGVPRAHLAGLL